MDNNIKKEEKAKVIKIITMPNGVIVEISNNYDSFPEILGSIELARQRLIDNIKHEKDIKNFEMQKIS